MTITSLSKHLHYTSLTISDIERIAKDLGKAQSSSNGWICLCPTHDDRNPSLSISLGSNGRLLLHCFSRQCGFKAILQAIKSRGLLDNNRNYACPHTISSVKPIQQEKKNSTSTQKYIKGLWDQAKPAAETLVETYSKSRGLTIAIPDSIRFLESCWHKEGKRYWPCMLAAVKRWPSDDIISLHRTYLQRDGLDKAPIYPEKKMLGGVTSGAVRFPGETPSDLACIAVAEGIENALTCWQERGRMEVWACLSAPGLKSVILPPPEITKEVVIVADNDSPGIAAAKELATRLTKEGRKVYIIMPSQERDDMNSLLKRGSYER